MENLDREAKFHDARAAKESSGVSRLGYVYESISDVISLPVKSCPNGASSILEVGCYLGDNSRLFGGIKYVGIDISPVAIELARKNCDHDLHEFLVHDANHLEMLGNRFDYIFGNGVIHHLDLDRFISGLDACLEDEGEAVFFEPLQGPFYLRLFRYLTPNLRTIDEQPLTQADLVKFEKFFDVEVRYFGLIRPIFPMLFANAKFIVAVSKLLDDFLVRTKLKSQAWIVVLKFTRKRK